jgi:hypothetical protein
VQGMKVASGYGVEIRKQKGIRKPQPEGCG